MFWKLLNIFRCKISGFSACKAFIWIYLALFFAIVLTSCNPDSFMLNKYEERCWIQVKMLNGIEKAEKINENSFKINENAIISTKVIQTTQYSSDFDLKLIEGGEIDFYLFTTEYDFEEIPYLKIILTDKNYRIEKEGQIIAESDTLKVSSTVFNRVQFHQENAIFRFKFDCAMIQIPEVKLNSSEYIIIRTKENTKAIIRGLTNTENYIKTNPDWE